MAAIAATSASEEVLGDRIVIMSFLNQVNGNRPHSVRDVTKDQFDDLTSFVGEVLIAGAPPVLRFIGWGFNFNHNRDC
jgi:hypothetical protein